MQEKMSFDEIENLEALPDEELVAMSQSGVRAADEIICVRYKELVKLKVRPYFLMGADREDVIQEGMIGLFKAMRDYNPAYNNSFRAFAGLCIVRHVLTAVTGANNKRNMPLNSYVSLYMNVGEQEDGILLDILDGSTVENPEDIAANRESDRQFFAALFGQLSELEQNCLTLYLRGMSYVEIAQKVQRSPKAVDNALQRIRKKISVMK